MTAIEKAAIELHEILWESVGDTGDWPIRIEYDDSDQEAATRLCAALEALRCAIKEVYPDHAPWPLVIK